MTTQQKIDDLQAMTGSLDSAEHDLCWWLLNRGCGIGRIVAMRAAGNLIATPWQVIPLTE